MNIENTIREAVHSHSHSHSGEAPESAGLLGAAEARSSRRRQRRHVAGAGIAVAATITAVLVAPAAIRGVTGEAAPGNATAAAQSPAQEAGSTTLVPAPAFEMPDFPFTPGWVPEGLSEAYYKYDAFAGSGSLRHYDLAHLEENWVGLNVNVVPADEAERELAKVLAVFNQQGYDEDEPTDPSKPLTSQTVTVRGQEAVLLSNEDGAAFLSIPYGTDEAIRIDGGPAEDTIRYAEELVEKPFAARTPFTFDLVPEGATLSWMGQSSMMLEGPPVPGAAINAVEVSLLRGASGMPIDCPLSVAALPEEEQPNDSGQCPLPRTTVQVGEHGGELVGDHMVLVYLEDGLALSVETAGDLALSGADLLRLAAGIHVTPDSLPRS